VPTALLLLIVTLVSESCPATTVAVLPAT
jgi:hypothetical protein